MDQEERYLEAVTSAEAKASRVLVTLLFTDIVGSTEHAAELGDRAWTKLIEAHHTRVRELLTGFEGREVDCAGDGFFATFDVEGHRLWRCHHRFGSSAGLEVRAGIHTGECERLNGRVRGIAVHTAARLTRLALAGEVLVTGTVRDVVAGSGIAFEDRGARTLQGVPGVWRIYAVAAGGRRTPDVPVVADERTNGRLRSVGWRAGPRTAVYSGARSVRNR